MAELIFTIEAFQNFFKEKKLMASRCKQCGSLWLPPRPICESCHGHDLEWAQLSGKGKIVAFTVIGVGSIPMIKAGYNRDNPYCVGIVETEEGPRINGQIMDVDVKNPENIKLGTDVTAEFIERGSWHFIDEVASVPRSYLVFRA